MTPKERAFCTLYAKNGSAHQSALDAGYTPYYAKSKSALMLNKPHIIAEIKRVRTHLDKRADKSSVDVVNEFSKIAFTDRVGFLKEDPHYPDEFIYKAPDELTPDQRAIVEKVMYNTHEITVIENGEVQKLWVKHYTYVLSDKAKALENMGRHFGIFDDRLRLGASQSNPFAKVSQQQLEQLRKAWTKTMTDPKLLEGEFKEVSK